MLDLDSSSFLLASVGEWVEFFMKFVLHMDEQLPVLIKQYGVWIYAILFLVIFCETGLVVTPILPGDSLLFAAGVVAAAGELNVPLLLVLLTIAAILGDAVNYTVGKFLGPKVLSGKYPFLKKEYLDKTQAFYDKYGGKTIILARFVPIVRTFAPSSQGSDPCPTRSSPATTSSERSFGWWDSPLPAPSSGNSSSSRRT